MERRKFVWAEVNKEKVRRLYEEVFGQGKTEVVGEVLDPNFVCYDPNAEDGEVRGLETIKGEIDRSLSSYEIGLQGVSVSPEEYRSFSLGFPWVLSRS